YGHEHRDRDQNEHARADGDKHSRQHLDQHAGEHGDEYAGEHRDGDSDGHRHTDSDRDRCRGRGDLDADNDTDARRCADTGKGCAGDSTKGPASWQNQSDGCLNIASDYIPGVTAVDCNTGEVGEGLGAAEFQVKFDDKIFQSPTFDCSVAPSSQPGVLGSTGRLIQTQVSVITENWVQFGCVTKDPSTPGQNQQPGACAVPLLNGRCPGPQIDNGAVLGTLTLTAQPDLLSRLRPAKDNGLA